MGHIRSVLRVRGSVGLHSGAAWTSWLSDLMGRELCWSPAPTPLGPFKTQGTLLNRFRDTPEAHTVYCMQHEADQMAHGETAYIAIGVGRVLIPYAWWLCRNGTSLAQKSLCGEEADIGVQLQSRS